MELVSTRAHNQLCRINDFRGVAGAPDLGNVAWLEMEDRWTTASPSCWKCWPFHHVLHYLYLSACPMDATEDHHSPTLASLVNMCCAFSFCALNRLSKLMMLPSASCTSSRL